MEMLLLLFKNSPIGRWVAGNVKTLIFGLVVLLAIGAAILYVRNLQASIKDRDTAIAAQQATIGTQKQQLVDAKSVNDALTQQLRLKDQSQKITDDTENHLAQVKTDNAEKTKVVQVQHDTYVKTVKADTTLAPDTKDKLIAGADISQIWQGYCQIPGVKNAACAQYSTLPNPETPVIPAAPTTNAEPPGPKILPAVTAIAQADDPPPLRAHIVPIALELTEA